MPIVSPQAHKGSRTLRVPFAEHEYALFVRDQTFARERLDQLYGQYPELFPAFFAHGYALYGFTARSRKRDLCCRRLRLVATATVSTGAPGFVMPSLPG